MTGYSSTILSKKLGIKTGDTVYLKNPPQWYKNTIRGEVSHITFLYNPSFDADVMHAFLTSMDELTQDILILKDSLKKKGILWISWPKKTSGVTTDITEDRVREAGLGAGLVDVKIAAVDDTWSGLKFVYRLKDR